jgi:hypothetical protein
MFFLCGDFSLRATLSLRGREGLQFLGGLVSNGCRSILPPRRRMQQRNVSGGIAANILLSWTAAMFGPIGFLIELAGLKVTNLPQGG